MVSLEVVRCWNCHRILKRHRSFLYYNVKITVFPYLICSSSVLMLKRFMLVKTVISWITFLDNFLIATGYIIIIIYIQCNINLVFNPRVGITLLERIPISKEKQIELIISRRYDKQKLKERRHPANRKKLCSQWYTDAINLSCNYLA